MNPSSSESLLIARLQELPPAERSAFLQRACAADPALRGRLEAIGAALVADVGSGTGVKTVAVPADGPLEPNWAARAFETALDLGDAETPGVSIGPYKLLEKIGEGGFGVVWMAEQHEPIRRRVAVKIIKTGMDTEEVIARFEAERQALALMEHPNIARIFDAGATVSGRPYFVMELVRGSAITRYCDENRLPAEARLRLFVTVCQAVQHAHQKGVIHRDLKPSNILVTLHDGVPVPKIIDFGIAKATSARLTEKTLFTQFHAFIGTPAYTSPEQMEMSGLDVDTRTDIYSLGVLLYELLAGRPPFDADSLVKSGLEAMRRTIREIDPPRPSHRLNTLSEVNRASVAQQRGTDAAKLSLMLRGDLDWIAMRCLEKDRTRRYDSATALAADVERHLSDDPVEARPPNRLYQANKFVRRHKLAVAAVTAVAASLVAGLIASSFLLVRERAAHARALSAEQKETDLRQQAEVARASEVKRAARTALDLANRHLADGRIGEGLAYLVYAARKDPTNPTLAPRLAFTLAAYNFLLPLGTPFVCNSRVLALHYARDGRTLLCCTEDGTLRAIDAASGELRSQFRLGRPVNPGGWEFAEDNETVVGVRFPDNTFGVYGIPSGQPRFAPVQLDPRVWSIVENIGIGHPVRLSPDGRWLCAYAAKQFWLWDAASGQLRLNPEFSDGIFGFNFSADSRRLAVTIGNSVQQWQLPDFAKDSESIVFRKPGSSSPANVHFSPDGRLLAVCDAAQCKVFDAVTGVELQTLPKTSGKFYTASLAFTDARHVLAKLNTRCGLWDLDSGKFTTLPLPAGDNLVTVDFDATGQRGLATSSDGLTRVFNAGTGTTVTEPAWPQRAAFCAAISPDGTQATIGTAAGMIYRLRIGGGPARPLLLPRSLAPIKPGPIRPGDQATDMPTPFLRETPDRLLWLTASNAKVIDVASGAEVAGGYAYPEPILGMFYNRYPLLRSDLKFMLVQTQRYEWQSWELGRDGVQRAAALQEPPPSPGEIAFSASADLVALPTSDSFRVWNLRTGLPAGPRFTYPTNINGTTLNFSPDGKLLAFAGNDGAAIVVEVATSRPVGSFKTRPLVANSNVAFSPDGTRLVTLNVRNEMILWNPVTRAAIGPAVGGIGWGQHARFSPDSRWLASWSDNRVALWDGRTGAPVGQAIPAGGHTVIFSADGNRLATAEQEGNVQVWDVPSGEPVTGVLPLPTPTANLPEFSPDGRFLKIENDYFTVWSIPPRPASGTAPPEWLLQLATICSSQVVNDAGQLTDASAEASRISALRREIAALPADAPYAEWGRWVLDDRADRSIAPCFSVTAAEADKLAADLAAAEGKK